MPRLILSICALLLLATAPTAQAQIYLRLVGQTQGPINGDVVLGPLTGTVETSSFSLSVTTQIDPTSGLPTGPPRVSPLLLTKGTDSATIGILVALDGAENLTTCVLEQYRDAAGGGTELYLRLTLTNARLETWNISADGSGAGSESISFVFDNLEWRDFSTGEVYSYSMVASSVDPTFAPDLGLITAPNPTSGPTKFAFRLPATGTVWIKVYDMRGRHVATVFDGETGSERGIASWDGRDATGRPVASGVYMVNMRAGEWFTTQKLSVLR